MGCVTVQWQGPEWLRGPARYLGLNVLERSTTLSLTGPGFSDAHLSHVAKLSYLKTLTLNQTAISDEGLERLQAFLPNCRIERVPLASDVGW